MTTVLSQKGQIVLPGSVRQQLHLEPGDDFQVFVEDDDTITLRRISRPANHGLVDLLPACPAPPSRFPLYADNAIHMPFAPR